MILECRPPIVPSCFRVPIACCILKIWEYLECNDLNSRESSASLFYGVLRTASKYTSGNYCPLSRLNIVHLYRALLLLEDEKDLDAAWERKIPLPREYSWNTDLSKHPLRKVFRGAASSESRFSFALCFIRAFNYFLPARKSCTAKGGAPCGASNADGRPNCKKRYRLPSNDVFANSRAITHATCATWHFHIVTLGLCKDALRAVGRVTRKTLLISESRAVGDSRGIQDPAGYYGQLREDYPVGERFRGLRHKPSSRTLAPAFLNEVPLNSPFRGIDTLFFGGAQSSPAGDADQRDIRDKRTTIARTHGGGGKGGGGEGYARGWNRCRGFAALYVRCLGLNIDFYFDLQVRESVMALSCRKQSRGWRFANVTFPVPFGASAGKQNLEADWVRRRIRTFYEGTDRAGAALIIVN